MKALVAVLAALSLITLAGCGAKNGSTKCGDWLGMTTSDQHTSVQNMMSDKGKNPNSELSYLGTLGSVKLFCATHPSSDTLDQIYHG
ncbi:MAG TPA: hypothetical protein VEO01_17575 [Pseudonocardiaceae bacterium]|nr:hypothetical protein [Pseudonocardiaceae bacterium]